MKNEKLLPNLGRLTNAERTVKDDSNNNYYIVDFTYSYTEAIRRHRGVYYNEFIIFSSGWRPTCGRVYSIMYTIISFVYALDIINSRAKSIRSRVINDGETDLGIL